ncbi:DUF4396 domain-containing protein [Salinimicrobium oceani]|uniref:DUF4396 domain-containing protein n=1 Tax=Salinimicrobium oceani TaxID=2722702 RepID=A0ABX1D0S2_9FLAO|nr:DUF4396 domain-containing protein [Salinimicrobium oceani]NJW52268.1 DUF4396 domain-containing protein [Salinimicrobium oceani]
MIRWTYPVLAVFILIVLSFGILLTIKEGVEVAGLVGPDHDPEKGRLTLHMKNTTRLTGDASNIYSQLQESIPYEEAKVASFEPSEDNWKEYVKQSITPDPEAKHVIIISGEEQDALQWSLPAVFFAAYHRSPVLFTEDLNANRNLLKGRKIFAVGAGNFKGLEGIGEVVEISAASPAALAVKLAEYHDEESEFGWGRKHERRTGYFQYVLTTPEDALNGLAALPLAKSNAAALLYAGDKGGIPAVTDSYIWSQRADWFVTPSEGPFRHFWVVSDRLSYKGQSRLDFSVEKSPYADMGAVALGPMEAIAIIFIALGIAGAIFILIHSSYALPEVMVPIKIAWTLGAALLPVLGVILYINAYRRPVYFEGMMTRWLRPPGIQAASATMMGFGYGAPAMIAVAYIFAYFGFPIFFSEGWNDAVFWAGAGMPLMMIGMYLGALLLVIFLVQVPMKNSMMEMKDGMVLLKGLKVAFLSMTAVSLGMMSMSWWMMMNHIPMMPKEDDILWFGTMWIASFIGFLVAWPLNSIMIRKNIKHGNR